MSKQARLTIVSLLFLLPDIASAHTGVGETSGFFHGFGHPLGGADHLLAMAAVGLWAAQIGGRALWLLPGTFISVMMLGGAFGFSGIAVPYIEAGILASVLILGALIAGALKLPIFLSASVVGFFALFHGYAHGSEMPAAIGATSYSVGFALATAMLHTVGITSGVLLKNIKFEKMNRLAGGAITLCGIYLVVL